MNCMISFEKKDYQHQKIPANPGLLMLNKGLDFLYIKKTANLQEGISRIFALSREDKTFFQLVSLADKISYIKKENYFAALVEEKIFLKKYYPEFNKIIKPYDNYVYLALDLDKVPYLRIVENTIKEQIYLGPFQDRFFLYDFIDMMAENFQSPVCEDDKYPCFRLKQAVCSGWCLKDKRETAEFIFRNFLISNSRIIEALSDEIESLFKELKFDRAARLQRHLEILKKYYDIISFLHVTKHIKSDITLAERTIRIESGLIAEVNERQENERFDLNGHSFRKNEYLAHDKAQLSERWLIYQYLKKNKLEQINLLLKKSLQKFEKIYEESGLSDQ